MSRWGMGGSSISTGGGKFGRREGRREGGKEGGREGGSLISLEG